MEIGRPAGAGFPGNLHIFDGRWLSGARLRAAAIACALVYIVAVSVFLLRQGSWPTPDFLIPPLILVALIAGRGWSFVIDWLPFLVLILMYESFRGIADDLGARVHIAELVDAERWLTGSIPTIDLQARFFDPQNIVWYDWLAVGLHAAHFAVPVACGFVLWLHSRSLYWRYAVSILFMFYAGFLTYYLYPSAPPWMAADMGLIPPVDRVLGHALAQLSNGSGLSLTYHTFSPNPVAAMPSLHAALPTLVAMVVIAVKGWKATPVLLYPIVGGIAWVYLGEHYVIDVVTGVLYAVVSFVCVWMLWPRVFGSKVVASRVSSIRGRFESMKQVPSWPLAIAVVSIGAYTWLARV